MKLIAQILLITIALCPVTVLAQTSAFDSAAIAKKTAPAVVVIKGSTDNGDVLGTGFLISGDGKLATNLHVIEKLRNGGVQLASGEKYDSFSVLAFDARKDIAIIKIAGFDQFHAAIDVSRQSHLGAADLAGAVAGQVERKGPVAQPF